MMIILNDQLFHLGYRVVSSIDQMLGNIWNFCPYDHSILIAQIIEILVMLIMCQSDTVCPDFPDQLHILIMMFFCDGISQFFPVLMAGNSVKRIGSSIQEKSLFRIKPITSEPDLLFHTICHLAVTEQLCTDRIQVWIQSSVPQMNLWNLHPACCSFPMRHSYSDVIQHAPAYTVTCSGYIRLGNQHSIRFFHFRSQPDSRTSEIIQIKMRTRHC